MKEERRPSRDQELSTEVLQWVVSSGDTARMPAQGWLLGFEDRKIERAYLDVEHRRNRNYYAVTLSIVTLLVASFIWTDPWLLPIAAVPIFRLARVYALLPLSALLPITATRITNPIAWIRLCAVLQLLFGFVHCFLLLVAGIAVYDYLELGMLQLVVATFLLFGLPVRWSLAVAIILDVVFGMCILHVEVSFGALANFSSDSIICALIGAIAAYRYENASRREFIAQLRSRKEYSERLAAEADRRRWLEVIADFLRHELKNSMTAISTSIEMADRAASQSEAGKYLDRGRHSVKYMHQLLTKVADATNLESALALHQFAPINLSKLVEDGIEGYRTDYQDRIL